MLKQPDDIFFKFVFKTYLAQGIDVYIVDDTWTQTYQNAVTKWTNPKLYKKGW